MIFSVHMNSKCFNPSEANLPLTLSSTSQKEVKQWVDILRFTALLLLCDPETGGAVLRRMSTECSCTMAPWTLVISLAVWDICLVP